jgi:hypothetical protein
VNIHSRIMVRGVERVGNEGVDKGGIVLTV